MAKRIGSERPLGRHFLKQWREFRELSLEDVAMGIDSSNASLSRIENFKQPYSQEILEALAEVYRCKPIDLLRVDPQKDHQGDFIDAYQLAGPERRAIAHDVLAGKGRVTDKG